MPSARVMRATFGPAWLESRPVAPRATYPRSTYGVERKWRRIDRRRARALEARLAARPRILSVRGMDALREQLVVNLAPAAEAFRKLAAAWDGIPGWQRARMLHGGSDHNPIRTTLR